ncbi:MAG: tetratricopeptide repeat protein [Bdellovibrionales bacterium]|nr:tetratricopeptide repeat protein [Bdellovibrionales bacterium]
MHTPNFRIRSNRIIGALLLVLGSMHVTGCYFYADSFSFGDAKSHAALAEELTAEHQYEAAIEEYRRHLNDRLTDEHRTAEENPYFYELLIGDLYLRLERVDDAINAYESALREKVDTGLVGERLRRLGDWYEERGQYEQAIATLRKYRFLDPLTFDLEIDRLHKASLAVDDFDAPVERLQRNLAPRVPVLVRREHPAMRLDFPREHPPR